VTRYLTVNEVLQLYRQAMDKSGGTVGILSMEALESAVAQPRATFDGKELYPSLGEKAAALGFSLVMNHAFVDGNKRVGHAGMEIFLVLNGFQINASVDEQEQIVLQLAAGKLERGEFTDWLKEHVEPIVS
jgi:death-on-curing protein